MASLRGTSNIINLMPKRLASHAASAPKKAEQKSRERLPVSSAKVIKTPKGNTLVHQENNSPISRVAAVFKVGPRDESYTEQGMVHALRVYSSLATKNSSKFGLTRRLDQLGVNFTVSSDRENMTYVVESTRNNIAAGIDALAEVVSRPQFRDWELRDSRQQLELDIEVFKATPEIRIVERLHKMAFKNALSNSLYAPKFNLGNLDNYQHVENFRDKHFNQNNMILVGLGIDESDLVRYSNDFIFASKGDKAAREPAKYAGGEYRKQNASELVQVALAFEGASLTSKDLVASGLLCHAFGTGPRVLHTAGSNRISKACLPGATHGPAMIAAFNMNYSDSGLFGFHVLANKGDAQNVVRSVFKDLAKAGSNGITNAELESAKNSLKFSLAEHLENPINQINTFAASPEHANEYANINSIAKAIDGVTVDCVNAFAKRVSAGKPTLVAVGNLSQFARLDDIRA